jgi:hypothetical protein
MSQSLPFIRGAIMPSENTFKSQIDLIRAYLTAFEAIIQLDAPPAIKSALLALSDSASNLHNFIPYFNTRPLYIETITMVYNALDNFFLKNPHYERPFSYKRVAGMFSSVNNLSAAEKRGKVFLFLFIIFG